MNFFAYQDQARRRTVWLVALFTVGVLGTIALLYVAVGLITVYVGGWSVEGGLWSPVLLAAVSALVLGVLGAGSGARYLSLRRGGSAVAETLGGRLLTHDADDAAERRLLNVVEEMAIASGTPVPPVYVLEEEGVNAFAAGHSGNDAVIGVTRGSLEALDRDELQGVIAHEFSHIVNEDVRLNLRLMIIVAGLITISVLGRQVLYSFRYARVGSSRSRRGGDSGRGQLVIILIALAFLVIGAVGVFCSRLIKAAVSRQREYLADASAVQFTRNPQGLARALKKIQGRGARITHPKAEEASHMFFGDALSRNALSRLWSTHPPLGKRIQRLDPNYEGKGAEALPTGPPPEEPVSMLSDAGAGPAASLDVEAAQIRHTVGTLSAEHLAYGQEMLQRLPAELRRAAHDPLGAVALAYALVLDDEPEHRTRQLALLREHVAPATAEEVERLTAPAQALDPWLRLPLAELLLPALRQMAPAQYAQFASALQTLMLHDEELSLFEFALSKMLLHQLEATYERRRTRRQKRITSLNALQNDVHVVLSALAQAGAQRPDEQQKALETGLARLSTYTGPTALKKDSFAELSAALDRLSAAAPRLKEQIIDACSHAALADRAVCLHEAEILRAVTATLDCPLPPFVPRAKVA